jgi:glycogen debranching enzyme
MDTTVLPQGTEALRPEVRATSKTHHGDKLPTYVVADTELEMGASLGNSTCWVTTKGTGDIESIFSTYLGQKVAGAVCVRYSGSGRRLELPSQEGGVKASEPAPAHNGSSRQAGQIQLYRQTPGRFVLHPAYQHHEYDLPGDIHVEETTFVPRVQVPGQARPDMEHLGMASPIVYQAIRLRNDAAQPVRLTCYGYAHLQGATPADVGGTYDSALGQGALVARNQSHPDWVRIFGLAGQQRVARWETGFDDRQIYETVNVLPLRNETTAMGAILGALQVDVELQPDKTTEFAFVFVFSPEGEAKAREIFRTAKEYGKALAETIDFYNRTVEVAEVLTPDEQINLGMTWAKVNMLRVMAHYPTGPAFTNDPSNSSAVVGRDACWFAWGCDWLQPAFSRALLDSLTLRQRESGLILEYYNAVTDERADNGFNINDNTPLFIIAARHHYHVTGDDAYLRRIYPAVRKAAQCILRQRDTELAEVPPARKRGLVTCTVRGVETLGIAGWRNIIPNYTLNGAVTEINAECAAALRAAAVLAEIVGTPEGREDAQTFHEAGEALVDAINTHLINPATGLYYLNIDLDGNVHTDVTADEIYPVLFGVAPDEVAYRVISRLNYSDFWTPAGIRTVSNMSPDYDPYRQWGLMGGVWPGVAWWYAYAARKYQPEATVEALRTSFEYYAQNPKKNNTVPGQFSEWMDGESLVNRGMRLSPWEPPRFVLAAVSGICGARAERDGLMMSPLVPEDWKWVGLRRLPYRGREVAYFAGNQPDGPHLYATTDFDAAPEAPNGANATKHLYDEDVTHQVDSRNPLAHHMAFKRAGEILVCLGSSAQQTLLLPLRLETLLDDNTVYQAEIYSSAWHRWTIGRRARGKDMEEAAVQIEAGGYRLFRFLEQPA